MFATRPGRPAPHAGPRLIRASRRTFPAPDESLFRTDAEAYFADMARPYGLELRSSAAGHSYGAMARALLETVVPPQEPVDLLILAFSIHDIWPGRATAAYLSHCCPGTPLSFAICDQGSAAAFTGLRIIRDYRAPRALLIAVEQAVLPYDSPVPPPDQHRGVALLCGSDAGPAVTAIRQHAGVPADAVANLVTSNLTELSANHHAPHLVLSAALAAAWPEFPADGVTVVPAGQPTTGVWWHLVDDLAVTDTDLVVAADYDPDLRYLCLATLTPT